MNEGQRKKNSASPSKPLVSIVLAAYNEEGILAANLKQLHSYMQSLEDDYDWEIVLVNDGSTDGTAETADAFAKSHSRVRVFHHAINFGLGQSLQFGFGQCEGDFVVTLDIDLSYSPDHIGLLLARIRQSKAKIVLASPYMKGGSIANVPLLRRVLSISANRFLSRLSQEHLSTFTSMARVYDGPFIRSLSLRAMDMAIMPETIYKAVLLQANVEQIPARLDWGLHESTPIPRRSSMRIMRHIAGTVLSGFVFRPFAFFVVPGLLLLIFAAYVNAWMFVHFFEAYGALGDAFTGDKISAAVAQAYEEYPHTFIVGLLSLMLSIQLLSVGILSLQSKVYFEEIFRLGSATRLLRRPVQAVSSSGETGHPDTGK